MPDITKSMKEGEIAFAGTTPKGTAWLNANCQSETVRFPVAQMPASVKLQEEAEEAGLSVGPVATPKMVRHAKPGT